MKINSNDNRIDTPLGELMATISEVAFECSNDTKEAYYLARLVLVEVLNGGSLTSGISAWQFTGTQYQH